MDKEHKFSIANYREVTTEREARVNFRKFRPELFESEFDQLFQSPKAFKSAIDEVHEYDYLYMGIHKDFLKSTPDMFFLSMVFWHVNGDMILKKAPDLHQELIGMDDESIDNMFWNGLGNSITWGGILPKLRDATAMAFTPKESRAKYVEKDPSPNQRIELHFAKNVPDLSNLGSTESRLDALTKLLSYDINDALQEVLGRTGLDITQFGMLKTQDPALFRSIHKQAGLLYVENNLNAILMDLRNRGQNNLFRNRPDLGNRETTTDTGVCTGENYAMNYVTGLGKSLLNNREVILEAIRQ